MDAREERKHLDIFSGQQSTSQQKRIAEEENVCDGCGETYPLDDEAKYHISDLYVGMMDAEAIKKMSVVEVRDSKTVEKRVPRMFGANDHRMGPTERGRLCGTCRQTTECSGHTGHIDLAVPAFVPANMDQLVRILNSVCASCSRLRMSRSHPKFKHIQELTGRARLKAMAIESEKMTRCKASISSDTEAVVVPKKKKRKRQTEQDEEPQQKTQCGACLPTVFKMHTALAAEFTCKATADFDKQAVFPRWNPQRIWEILDAISDQDAIALGCNPEAAHPRTWMMPRLLVEPTTCRPGIVRTEASRKRGDHEVTVKYVDIVKANNRLKNLLKASPEVLSQQSHYRICKWKVDDEKTITCKCNERLCTCVKAALDALATAATIPETKEETPTITKKKGKKPLCSVQTENRRECIVEMATKLSQHDREVLEVINDVQSNIGQLQTGEVRNSVIHSKDSKYKISTNAQNHSISFGLTGKGGRIRGNMLGKRQDFSARTVVAGNDSMSINTLGVPYNMCRKLTVPEIVTAINRVKMTNLLRKGEINYVSYGNVEFTSEFIDKQSLVLQLGMKVERWLQDGDLVLFNRQPSLHASSMLALRVKRLPPGCDTFQVPIALTTPYNFDCDGDEMMMVVPRSLQARAEAYQLLDSVHHVKSVRSGSMLIGINQHAALSAYLATCDSAIFLNWADFSSCLYQFTLDLSKSGAFSRLEDQTQIESVRLRDELARLADVYVNPERHAPEPAIRSWACSVCESTAEFIQQKWACKRCQRTTQCKKVELWTGSQLFSMFSPRYIDIKSSGIGATGNVTDDKTKPVGQDEWLIEDGELLVGAMEKKRYWAFLHAVAQDYGEDVVAQYISGITRVWHAFMEIRGSTVSPRDCLLWNDNKEDSRTRRNEEIIHKAVEWAETQTDYDIINYNNSEAQVNSVLEKAWDVVNKRVVKAIQSDTRGKPLFRANGLYDTVRSGAKGSTVNLTQIIGSNGQNKVGGRRLISGGPHFRNNPHDPKAHGFVSSSFAKGLDPDEFVAHMCGGREGIVDTGAKTSAVGYLARRLVKNLDDTHSATDGTVRGADGLICQWSFGGDNYNPRHLEDVELRVFADPFESLYKYDDDDHKVFEDEYAFLLKIRNSLNANRPMNIKNGAKTVIHRVTSPVGFSRLLFSFRHWPSTQEKKMDAKQVIARVQKIWKRLEGDRLVSKSNWDEANGSLLHALFCDWFNTQRLAKDHPWMFGGHDVWDNVEALVVRAVARARIEYGDMVGIVAAQSIAEPGMQLTLRTFHLAGRNQADVSGFRPLDNITSLKPQAGFMVVKFRDDTISEEMAQTVAKLLVYTPLRRVLNSSCVVRAEEHVEKTRMDRMWESMRSDTVKPCPYVIRLCTTSAKYKSIVAVSVAEFLGDPQNKPSPAGSVEWSHVDSTTLEFRIAWSHPKIHKVAEQVCATNGATMDTLDDNHVFSCYYAVLSALKEQVYVQGLPRITGATATQVDKKWVIQTQGSNLEGIARFPQLFNVEETTSDNLQEVSETFGIEAARSVIESRVRQIMADSDCSVDHRYTCLLADSMARSGHLIAMTSRGFEERNTSVWRNLAFEHVLQNLQKAGMFGAADPLVGVTERFMSAGTIPCGAGMVHLRTKQKEQQVQLTLPAPKTVEELHKRQRISYAAPDDEAFFKSFESHPNRFSTVCASAVVQKEDEYEAFIVPLDDDDPMLL